MKKILHKIALAGEATLDLLRPRRDDRRIIEPYAGYATQQHMIVRGRVLTALRRRNPLPHQSKFTNFRQIVSLFLTSEVADVPVRAGEATALSDEEGYFSLVLPRSPDAGWVNIPVTIDGREGITDCPVYVSGPDAELLIISDIDDTVLETGAYSLARNLWTSFTGNALTRRIYPDAVQVINALSADHRNPVFFVSSSPWNLFSFLNEIFDRAGLVKAPMLLRDLGLSETKFITDDHGSHKGGSINLILDAIPDLPVVLLGDTGQKDSVIYADICERFPDRVLAVILRETDDGSDVSDRAAMARIENLEITLFHGKTFPTADAIRGLQSQVPVAGHRL